MEDLVVEEAARLDVFVAARVPTLTRAQVKRLVDDGDVLVNGAPASKAGHALRAGDRVSVRLRPPEPIEAKPEAIPLVVLFEDEHLIVIDKAAGMVVHPAPGHSGGTLVNALLAHCGDLSGIGGAIRPGIVHRIDKDTTGILVVSKSDAAHTALAESFASKSRRGVAASAERERADAGATPAPAIEDDLIREYLAVVRPSPRDDAGTIRTLYGRHPVDRKKFSSKVAKGKSAITHWRVVERFADGAALLRLRLETGRTHQIRVHMADHGWPLIGDTVYGRKSPAIARQALHATRLDFTHPVTGERLAFESPVPADMEALIRDLR